LVVVELGPNEMSLMSIGVPAKIMKASTPVAPGLGANGGTDRTGAIVMSMSFTVPNWPGLRGVPTPQVKLVDASLQGVVKQLTVKEPVPGGVPGGFVGCRKSVRDAQTLTPPGIVLTMLTVPIIVADAIAEQATSTAKKVNRQLIFLIVLLRQVASATCS